MLDQTKLPIESQPLSFNCHLPSFYQIHLNLYLLVIEGNRSKMVGVNFQEPKGYIAAAVENESDAFLVLMLFYGEKKGNPSKRL